jgi:hypothetical protein
MQQEGEDVGGFVDELRGGFPHTVPCSGLDANQKRLI